MQAKYDSKVLYQGVWFLFITWKVTHTQQGQQVLTSAAKELEWKEREWYMYAVQNVWGFLHSYFCKLICVQAAEEGIALIS